jgi:hypothetical protein
MKPERNTYSVRYEIAIDRSPEDVWKQLGDFQSWNPEYDGATVERLAGNPHQEGEVVRIQKTFGDPFTMHVVKLVPGKQVVWANFDAEGGASDGMSFVDNSVEGRPGGSTLRYSLYGYTTATDGQEFDRDAFEASVVARLDEIMPSFKQHVESA